MTTKRKRAGQSTPIDPAWQNPDGTLRDLSRAQMAELSFRQKTERRRAKERQYQADKRAAFKRRKAECLQKLDEIEPLPPSNRFQEDRLTSELQLYDVKPEVLEQMRIETEAFHREHAQIIERGTTVQRLRRSMF